MGVSKILREKFNESCNVLYSEVHKRSKLLFRDGMLSFSFAAHKTPFPTSDQHCKMGGRGIRFLHFV
jgi:hypothetical protein